MKLTIQNKTEYLNEYYFQTLCLLYFPGEKFQEGYESPAEASFLLEHRATASIAKHGSLWATEAKREALIPTDMFLW